MEMKDKVKEIWQNYSIFSQYIRRQMKKEEEKAIKQGKTFTVKQIKNARTKYTRQARIIGVKFISAVLATGLIGTSGYQLGKNNVNQQQRKEGIERQEENTKFTSDYEGDITIEGNTQTLKIERGLFNKKTISEKDTWDSWKEDIKVDVVLPSDIATKVSLEIKHLKTSEEILQYVKQQYVEEYNKNNEQKIKVDEIEITKSNLGYITKDHKQGRLIYDPYEKKENNEVYTIKHNGKILEEIARTLISNDYKRVYRKDKKEKENHTEEIYAVIAEGMDYCIGYESYEKGETSKEILSKYQDRLKNRVYQKEINKYQSMGILEKKQTETTRETDNEREF